MDLMEATTVPWFGGRQLKLLSHLLPLMVGNPDKLTSPWPFAKVHNQLTNLSTWNYQSSIDQQEWTDEMWF